MTDSFTGVLDRDLATVAARETTGIVCPLLREVVNHATWAHQRCLTEKISHGGQDEDLAPVALYLHVIGATDGIEVLLGSSIATPAIPLLRSSFEACLSIEYIFEENFSRKSLSWLCHYIHSKLDMYALVDGSTARGQEFSESWKKRFSTTTSPTPPDIEKAIANLQGLLAKPHLVPIEQEYQQRNGPGQWSALFGGPPNVRALAENLDRLIDYDIFYRYWSRISHAADLGSHITRTGLGQGTFKTVRSPQHLAAIGHHAAQLQIRATRLMLKHYRDGENLGPWYAEEIQPKLAQIGRLNDVQE